MTVHQFLNGIIYAGALAGALSGIALFFHYAAVRPLRGFLRREIVSSLVDIKEAVEKLSNLEDKLDEHIQNGGHVQS